MFKVSQISTLTHNKNPEPYIWNSLDEKSLPNTRVGEARGPLCITVDSPAICSALATQTHGRTGYLFLNSLDAGKHVPN